MVQDNVEINRRSYVGQKALTRKKNFEWIWRRKRS